VVETSRTRPLPGWTKRATVQVRRTTLLFRSVHEIKVAVALKQKRNRSTEITRQAKIVFSPIDRSDLSKKGHAFVREDKLVGMDLEFMIGDGAGSFPGKVEIRVLSKAKRVGQSLTALVSIRKILPSVTL